MEYNFILHLVQVYNIFFLILWGQGILLNLTEIKI